MLFDEVVSQPVFGRDVVIPPPRLLTIDGVETALLEGGLLHELDWFGDIAPLDDLALQESLGGLPDAEPRADLVEVLVSACDNTVDQEFVDDCVCAGVTGGLPQLFAFWSDGVDQESDVVSHVEVGDPHPAVGGLISRTEGSCHLPEWTPDGSALETGSSPHVFCEILLLEEIGDFSVWTRRIS